MSLLVSNASAEEVQSSNATETNLSVIATLQLLRLRAGRAPRAERAGHRPSPQTPPTCPSRVRVTVELLSAFQAIRSSSRLNSVANSPSTARQTPWSPA